MWRYAALAIATTSSAIACVGLFTSVPLSRVSSADRSLVESEIRPLASYEFDVEEWTRDRGRTSGPHSLSGASEPVDS
jgi:hypothetical protein